MNDNLNLVEILKDCPEGTKLYSPVLGEVDFVDILEDCIYPIRVIGENGNASFTSQGKLFNIEQGECILFPSHEERDWSKFKPKKAKFNVGDKIVNLPRKYMGASGTQGIISKITDDKYFFTDGSYIFISDQDSWELVYDKFDPQTLQSFDKVLVRDSRKEKWQCSIFSYINNDDIYYPYVAITTGFKCCIPYNEETKHLIGTIEEAPEFYRYWKE